MKQLQFLNESNSLQVFFFKSLKMCSSNQTHKINFHWQKRGSDDTKFQKILHSCFHWHQEVQLLSPFGILTVQRGQIHSPLGISGSGGLRQWMWYDEGQESQHSSSPPSLQTLQNSMWWSSSSISPVSPLSSSASDTSSLASHWMPSFSCGFQEEKSHTPTLLILGGDKKVYV